MDDDIQPVTTPRKTDLDLLSVEELTIRIAGLQQEIADCEAAIARKGTARSKADAMFNFRSEPN
jgi:uncharacterized small protein (DUF1192 family)